VREVDDLLAGHAGEEIFVAAGEADHLVREHRADDQAHVVLHHGPVEDHVHVLAQPPLRQLGDPVGRDAAEAGQLLRAPPLVVAHREAGVGAAEVRVQLGVAHRPVRTERHQDRDARGAAVQRLVHRAEQQRQRAAAGAVRHDDAHAAPVQVGPGQLVGDEGAHGGGVEDLVRAADQDHGSSFSRWSRRMWLGTHRPPARRSFEVGGERVLQDYEVVNPDR
jgi:hypothetical protein